MRKALSLSDLSDLSHVSPVTINRIENGQQKPRPRTLRSLARGLGIRVEELTTGNEFEPNIKNRASDQEPS